MILSDLNYKEITGLVESMGEKSFRAIQIFKNVQNGKAISEMSDLSLALRQKLTENYSDISIKVHSQYPSKDGSVKYLYKLCDGNLIEGVLMKYKYGYTQCVSTQVGCRMGCAFCASTLNGLKRNLTAGEILEQITVVNRLLGGSIGDRKITNIVLMGSGEPFDNYDNVVKFLRLVTAENGLNFSARNISLSTCGLVDKMYDFAKENIPLNLTVSLHSPIDDERVKIMPVAKAYSVSEIIKACQNYFDVTGRRYIFEYSLISGANDKDSDIAELIRLLKGKPCHVNLIKLNEVKERGLKGVGDINAKKICKRLNDSGISATIRRTIGADIQGACGQLRAKVLGENG